MPVDRFETVVLVPVPVVVVPLGFLIKVHVPLDGKPFKVTLPVDTLQVGCVVVPTEGAVGALGAVLMTILPDAAEVQLAALVTVKL